MELEALQLPEADLQVLNLEPPVPPPDQVVSSQESLVKTEQREGQSLLGGGTCRAKLAVRCQAAASVRPSSPCRPSYSGGTGRRIAKSSLAWAIR